MVAVRSDKWPEAVYFFQREAWYSVPPGRILCALGLAQAEAVGEAVGWRVKWDEDDNPDLSWCDDCLRGGTELDYRGRARAHEHRLFFAVLLDRRGKVLGSLCGIDFGPNVDEPSGPYMRVVAAELMAEAIAEGGA